MPGPGPGFVGSQVEARAQAASISFTYGLTGGETGAAASTPAADDEVLIGVFLASAGTIASQVIDIPGYTAVRAQARADDDVEFEVRWYRKRMGSTPDTGFTVNLTTVAAGGTMGVIIQCWRGIDATVPLDGVSPTSTTALNSMQIDPPTSPSSATASNRSVFIVLGGGAHTDDVAYQFTIPAFTAPVGDTFDFAIHLSTGGKSLGTNAWATAAMAVKRTLADSTSYNSAPWTTARGNQLSDSRAGQGLFLRWDGVYSVPSGGVTLTPAGLRSASTIHRPTITANANLAPAGLRSSSTLARPSIVAGTSLAPQGLRSASSLQRPALTATTALSPASLRSGSSIVRPSLVVSALLAPQSLRSASTIQRPSMGDSLAPRSLRSLSKLQRPTITPSAVLVPRSLASPGSIARPSIIPAATLSPAGLQSPSTIQRPTLSGGVDLAPRSLRSLSRLQRPTLTAVASLTVRSLLAPSSISLPAIFAPVFLVPQSLRSSTSISRPSLLAGVDVISRDVWNIDLPRETVHAKLWAEVQTASLPTEKRHVA